jgi:hypothetical protein
LQGDIFYCAYVTQGYTLQRHKLDILCVPCEALCEPCGKNIFTAKIAKVFAKCAKRKAKLWQATVYYRAVQRAGHDTPFGQFLNHAEKAAVEGGRELIRHSLEGIVQEAVHEVEKKATRSHARVTICVKLGSLGSGLACFSFGSIPVPG